MRLFSQSVADAVEKMVQTNEGRRTLVTLPSFEASLMLDIAERMVALASRYGVVLELKIASRTLETWEQSKRDIASRHGWEDTRGNLTYYRNAFGTGEKQLVVLCGADKVTDTAGLEDFTFCDEGYIWAHNGDKIFETWLKAHFAESKLQLPEQDSFMSKVYDLLRTLRLLPSGGLLHISEWLDDLNVQDIERGKELLEKMLVQLSNFNLPNCIGFANSKSKSKSFMQYAKAAQPFFDYSSLIKFENRKKVRNNIEKSIERLKNGDTSLLALKEYEKKLFPSYVSIQKYFDGLLNYVNTENEEDREKIFCCDFVSLHDIILKTTPSRKKPQDKPKILHGQLFDSLLTAMWLTLEQCCKEDKELVLPAPLVFKIQGESYKFINEGDASQQMSKLLTDDLNEYAKEQLRHLVEGVDVLLENYLQDEKTLFISCDLLGKLKAISTKKQTSSFTFTVELFSNLKDNENPIFNKKFEWLIPEKHSERLDVELISRAHRICSDNRILPVFHVQYYDELLNASDGDDTYEVLWHSLRDKRENEFVDNLLGDNPEKTPYAINFISLINAYNDFLQHAAEHSLFDVFNSDGGVSPWQNLKLQYEAALEKGKELAEEGKPEFGAMLMRSFLVINKNQTDGWRTHVYEDSAIVTVLHPALLEQIQSRIIFLCAGFRQIYSQERTKIKKRFSSRVLQHYLCMARTHAPLCTLLRTRDRVLTGEVRGEGHIHKIGHVETLGTDTLSTRLRSEGEGFQEELRDADLYVKSEESRLFKHLLNQYYILFPHASDGISVAIFRNGSIQPIIAGVHEFLRSISGDLENRTIPYDVRLHFLSDSSDATDLRIWLTHWQKSWNVAREEDSQSTNFFYRHCRITVSHQLVRTCREIESLAQPGHFEVDIAFLYDMFETSKPSCVFEKISSFDVTDTELKFPILEKKSCVARNKSLDRARVLSVRQFPIATRHTELLAALRQMSSLSSSESLLVVSTGNFDEWKNPIACLHEAAEWVVCIDPALDEALIRDSVRGDKVRDIVAFGSGVGSHGEANYTVSSEQTSCHELCRHIGARLASLYTNSSMDAGVCYAMAEKLLHAEKLAGMALIRAASLQDEHIHDFLAYSLSRRLLRDEDALCDTMISLDAYHHWLPSWDTAHPDLLWITVHEHEGKLHLYVRVVECKLARSNDGYIFEAQRQLREGLAFLEPHFRPRSEGEIDDARPDRRYWWHQLHRVISSSMYAEDDSNRINMLLEQLAEGQFAIEWGALLLTNWLDNEDEEIRLQRSWKIETVPAYHLVIGWPVQKRLALDEGKSEDWAKVVADICQKDVANTDEYKEEEQQTEQQQDGSEDYVDEPEEQDEDGTALPWERKFLPADKLEPGTSPTPSGSEIDGSSTPNLKDNRETDKTAPTIVTSREKNEDQDNKNISETEESIVNISVPEHIHADRKQVPEQILFGKNRSGQPVYWKFRSALNQHLVIFGSSGSGKTYAMQCLLAELARQGQNNLVMDYSQSFIPGEIKEPVKSYFPISEQRFLARTPFPINPLKRQKIFVEGLDEPFDEKSVSVAGRITDICKKIFNLGTQQVNILQEAVIECIDGKQEANFSDIAKMLNVFRNEDRYNKNTIDTLKNHICSLLKNDPFADPKDDMGWERLYAMVPACNHVFQLMSVPPVIAAGIIEFVLWDLFYHSQRIHTMKNNGNITIKIIALDEIQNLRLEEGAPVYRILTEGRKLGLSLIAATQSISPVKQFMSTLQQAAYKLYFRPADSELNEFANQLQAIDSSWSSKEWKQRLANLGRGECYVIGQQQSGEPPVRFVKISSMEERNFDK